MSSEYLGLSTLECARSVVSENMLIRGVVFRTYNYIPNQTSNNEHRTYISRDSLLEGFDPNTLLAGLGEGYNVALDSGVDYLDLSMEPKFFLMADLAPQKSPENQQKIEEQFRKIILPHYGGGFLLETNRSYHYLGMDVTDKGGWLDFLGRCLITSIVTKTPDDQPNIHEVMVDYRYVGHSILRRSTGLRVTTNGSKTFEPRSIAVIL